MTSFSGHTAEPSTTVVQNDGWWPVLPLAALEAIYRLPEEYAEATLVEAVQLAMAWTNEQLASWKADQVEADYASMDAVPCDSLGETSLHFLHYRRAVFSYAKAYLLEQFPTINRRDAAVSNGKEDEDTAETFLAFATRAVADFLKRPSVTVELI